MWELGEAVQMGFFLLPDLHPFSAAMVSRYSVMGARRNLIVGLLPLSVLSSGDCSVSLFCVCTVLHRHVEQSLHLDGWRGNEPTNLCQILGDIAREDLLSFFPHVLISFFLAYASVFLCATRVTDIECVH